MSPDHHAGGGATIFTLQPKRPAVVLSAHCALLSLAAGAATRRPQTLDTKKLSSAWRQRHTNMKSREDREVAIGAKSLYLSRRLGATTSGSLSDRFVFVRSIAAVILSPAL